MINFVQRETCFQITNIFHPIYYQEKSSDLLFFLCPSKLSQILSYIDLLFLFLSVLDQDYSVSVHDAIVIQGNTAILR